MRSRWLPKTSRVSPVHPERKEMVDKEFEIIEKFFWMAGIVFTRSRVCGNIHGFFIACLDLVFSVLYIYFTVATFYLAATQSPHSAGYSIINAFANFSGICIRFVVLMKRRQIRKCIDAISRLDSDILTPNHSESMKKRIYVSCICAVFLPLLQMFLGAFIENPHNGYKKFEALYLFGAPVPQRFSTAVQISVVFIRAVNVILCKSLPFLAVILCSFVFTHLRNINRNFIVRLKASIDKNSSSTLFSDYTVFYCRITKTIEQVEKSYSVVSFFLYGHILSCIFSVTSFLVSNQHGSPQQICAILYQLITLIEIVSCFIILSMRAASVNESAVEVKNVMHTLPSKQFDFNPNLTATLLQLSNNFAEEVCMTGWGLFVINRGFILTTAGVVVSYGVILVQLGK